MPSKKTGAARKKPGGKKPTSKMMSTKKSASTSASKASSKKGSASVSSGDRRVTIRMYNVGFGDAFLVLLPDGDSQRRILFDCGSIEAAADKPMSSIVDRIVRDVTDADGVPRIDVVVATHRHKDHVSGFGQAAWDKVEVKEVWMPWTEHPTDAEARRIRDIQSRLALGLDAALKATSASLSAAERAQVNRYSQMVANALMLSNEKAMKTLHSGFIGNPKRRFLPAKSGETRLLETEVLPGVKVHVLGPSRSRDIIRDMDPPKGESFLRLRGAVSATAGGPRPPFSSDFIQEGDGGAGTLSIRDQEEIQRAASLSDLAIAVALDKAVNGTSLMLLLEISGTLLLFPGDAQWGTWNAAMQDDEWKEMLGRLAFYKIGHHGSHNATPIRFVKKMIPEDICAMASTLTRDIWPEIPKDELLTGLVEKRARIARSDQPSRAGNTFRVDQDVIETHIAL